jgi:hypothetical protein
MFSHINLTANYFRKNYLLILVGFSSLILIIVHFNLRSYAFDDAYIHFRISSHLVNWGTPFFNKGEAVMVSSSTGWVIIQALIMAGFKLVGVNSNLPILTSIINAIACTGGAYIYVLIFDFIAQKGTSTSSKLIFFLMYLALIIPVSTGLMETPIAMLLAGLGLLLIIKNSRWGLVILGSLPFFRPELLIVTLLAVFLIRYTKRFSIKDTVLFYSLGAIPFILFDLYFFKTLIPNTIIAKSLIYSRSYIDAFSFFFSKIYGQLGLLGTVTNISLTQKLYYLGYILWLTLSFVIIFCYKTLREFFLSKRLGEKELLGVLFLVWFCGVAGVYLFRRVLIFSWYDPLYTIPLLMVIAKTVMDIQECKIATVFRIILLPLILVQISGLVQLGLAAFIDPKYAPEFLSSARVRIYIELGKQLYEQYPESTLMTTEIGGLGYGFQGYIYDGAGLSSPGALKYHPLKNPLAIGGIPAGFVQEVNPDLIVSYDPYIIDLLPGGVLNEYIQYKYPILLADDFKRVGYQPVYKSDALNLFVKKTLPQPNITIP